VETNLTEVYDPATNTWATAADLPSAVFGYASAVLNGHIYIIGGSKSSPTSGNDILVNSNQVYNPQTNTWSSAANLPSAASYGAAIATVGFMAPARIYFVGGYFTNSYLNTVQVYNPANDSWSPAVQMPTPRAYLGLTEINDVIYAIGGFDGQNYLDAVEAFTPIGYGTAPPQIQITSPQNTTYTQVSLEYTLNRPTAWVGYSLDQQANITLNGQPELLNASQGANSIVVYANDSLGNMGASNIVDFSIDRIPPTVMIEAPKNQSYGSTDIQLIFTVDKNASRLTYSLDGQGNISVTGNVTLPALLNGPHSLTVYATDSLGNEGSKTVDFNISPFPTIPIVAVVVVAIIILTTGYLFYKGKLLGKKALVNSV